MQAALMTSPILVIASYASDLGKSSSWLVDNKSELWLTHLEKVMERE